MTTRGAEGWRGDKPKRLVGTKNTLPADSRRGVVAPFPINTPSLRKEIHGMKGDNAARSSINRSSAGTGWGSAVGGGWGSTGTPASVKDRGDAFTRHFPDLRAGANASTKAPPAGKLKSEPPSNQGPSLRPRGMLKPTGSSGGGSAATARAQAAIAEAVHNRAVWAPMMEERGRKPPTFTAGGRSRWTERSYLNEGGVRGRGGGGRAARFGVRGRESTFASGANVKPLAPTYVRQHGPPRRRITVSSPSQEEGQPAATQQPTRGSAYSASTRPDPPSEKPESWGTLADTPSKSCRSPPLSPQLLGSPEVSAVDSSQSSSWGGTVDDDWGEDTVENGDASQPWSDPRGSSAGGDETSNAMPFLGNGPSEAPKGRYLPPALRNSTPSARNGGDTSSSAGQPFNQRQMRSADNDDDGGDGHDDVGDVGNDGSDNGGGNDKGDGHGDGHSSDDDFDAVVGLGNNDAGDVDGLGNDNVGGHGGHEGDVDGHGHGHSSDDDFDAVAGLGNNDAGEVDGYHGGVGGHGDGHNGEDDIGGVAFADLGVADVGDVGGHGDGDGPNGDNDVDTIAVDDLVNDNVGGHVGHEEEAGGRGFGHSSDDDFDGVAVADLGNDDAGDVGGHDGHDGGVGGYDEGVSGHGDGHNEDNIGAVAFAFADVGVADVGDVGGHGDGDGPNGDNDVDTIAVDDLVNDNVGGHVGHEEEAGGRGFGHSSDDDFDGVAVADLGNDDAGDVGGHDGHDGGVGGYDEGVSGHGDGHNEDNIGAVAFAFADVGVADVGDVGGHGDGDGPNGDNDVDTIAVDGLVNDNVGGHVGHEEEAGGRGFGHSSDDDFDGVAVADLGNDDAGDVGGHGEGNDHNGDDDADALIAIADYGNDEDGDVGGHGGDDGEIGDEGIGCFFSWLRRTLSFCLPV